MDLRELGVLGWRLAFECFDRRRAFRRHQNIDLASQATGGDGTDYVISLAPGATLTEAADIYAVNLAGNDTLTIDGEGATLDGAARIAGCSSIRAM